MPSFPKPPLISVVIVSSALAHIPPSNAASQLPISYKRGLPSHPPLRTQQHHHLHSTPIYLSQDIHFLRPRISHTPSHLYFSRSSTLTQYYHPQHIQPSHNTLSLLQTKTHPTMTSSMQEFEHFKNPHLKNHEDRDQLIGMAAAKGAGLALVAGGLIAMSGARYSKTYQTISPRLKQFLLGTGKPLFSSFSLIHTSLAHVSKAKHILTLLPLSLPLSPTKF